MPIVEKCDECGYDDGEILRQCATCYDKRGLDVWLCTKGDCVDIHEANEHAG
jgi:hypothetical protein